jgi:3-isopropylmalate/(R)-2-methylmalate dehydratase large subunit
VAQTLAQKIIARAAGRATVEVGEYLTVTPDYTCCQELAWPLRKRFMEQVGVERVAHPERVVMVVDHTTSAAVGSNYHRNHREMAAYAARWGVKNFFGAGSGLRHLVLAEQGFARPGTLIFSDEGNIASIGALGALNVPVSWEVVMTIIGETNWLAVPPSVRFRLEGALPPGVLVRDLVQILNRDFAATGELSQCCIEYCGPGLAALSIDDRQALCAAAYHTGADTAIMPVDQRVLDYVGPRAAGREMYRFESDSDAKYLLERTYDLSALEPCVTVPPVMESVVPVREVAGTHIDQAIVGSCASNRLDDMRATAAVLRGRTIAAHVKMYVTPGSREVYAACAREGLLEIFVDAGATVLAPGCSTCWGYEGALGAGEVLIGTHQHNYAGRNGSREASVYLASPCVVAASAIAGAIIDPREMLGIET